MYRNYKPQRKGGYRPKSRPFYRGSASPRRNTRAAGVNIDPTRFIQKAMSSQVPEAYKPQHAFGDFAIDERLKQRIAKKGYVQPTAIQDKAIPYILEGKDVIGVANTGTGKTAAFLVPLLNAVLANKKERVFIIAPTRELAFQIHEELVSLSQFLQIYSAVCIGGGGARDQIQRLLRNPHFVIGTPGRLKDFVERKVLRLETFQKIVLDEADRMLDMGFIHDVRFLMSKLPEQRQTLLFSATIPDAIEKLIRTFLKDPVKISVKSQETPANVEQDIVRAATRDEKLAKLCTFLSNQQEFSKVLVFGKTKHGVEKLSKILSEKGFRCASIHGDKTQWNRRKALDLFKKNLVQVLVATDVAARGLDIPNVSHVINFDQPATFDDYIHRIGRTGRANQRGVALTFV